MCLISFAWKQHSSFPLILVANRDEFYERPTAPMDWWSGNAVLAGRDLKAGGTWLGINRVGNWAAITNFREIHPARPDAPSRGELVLGFLQSNQTPEGYSASLSARALDYQGFNLLLGSPTNTVYLTNRGSGRKFQSASIEPGVHGLCNHRLNTPWPKLTRANQILKQNLKDPSLEPINLLEQFKDQHRPSDDQLPDTGVGLEKERMLSSIFISDDEFNYGTRCTTILTISNQGEVCVDEVSFPDETVRQFRFQIKTSLDTSS